MFLHALAALNTTAEEEWERYEACVAGHGCTGASHQLAVAVREERQFRVLLLIPQVTKMAAKSPSKSFTSWVKFSRTRICQKNPFSNPAGPLDRSDFKSEV